jgi:hypothetical protein
MTRTLGCASTTELDRNAVKPVNAASRTNRLPQRDVCKTSAGVGVIAPVLICALLSAVEEQKNPVEEQKNPIFAPSTQISHLPLPREGLIAAE